MHFRLRQDTLEWFKKIEGQKPIETMFDLYYFCLMVGLATGRTSIPAKRCPDYSDFIDRFVMTYRPYQRLIIGLLLRAELAHFGVSVKERDEVSKTVIDLVEPNSQTNLTDRGMERLNEYASGGFDYLSEKLDTKPHNIENFLRVYVETVREAVEQSRIWNSVSHD